MSRQAPTSVETRALELLGSGIQPESVAAALGVTPSYISQLLSDDEFSQQVTTLRYNALQKHNDRDNSYDSIEDKLLEKLDKSIPMMYKPAEILSAIKVVNAAKRRGQSAPQQITNQQNIVNLVLPTAITQNFVTNINNQVIKAGDQELLTIPSSALLAKAEKENEPGKTTPALSEEGGQDNDSDSGSSSATSSTS